MGAHDSISAVPTLARVSGAIGVALGAWLSLGAIAYVADGGATDRVGILPGPLWLSAFALAATAAALIVRSRADRFLPFLTLVVLALPWIPAPVPMALLAWAGPMATLVWAGVAVAFVASLPLRLPRPAADVLQSPRASAAVAACLAFVIYAAAAHRLHSNGLIPAGDEPHYLVITQSLLLDGDLLIENNHQRGDYRRYIDIPLKPDFLKRSKDRQVYSVHAPGLPALLIPAFAIAGYPGSVWFLALVAAAGTALAWHLAWKLTASASAAWFGWAAVALSTSFLFHAFAIYPEVVASVVFLLVVWALASVPTAMGWLGVGSAVALLPWLHSRFAVIAGLLGLCIVERILRRPDRWRCLLAFAAIPLLSAGAWFSFFWVIYGTPNPAIPYGGASPMDAQYLARGIVGLLFDHQFGLFAHAPVYLVACVGFVLMLAARRPLGEPGWRQRRLALEMLFVSVPYACVAAAYPMWWAGASAPARFLVPLLLPLALPAAVAWASIERRATRAWAFLLLAASAGLSLTLLVADGGRLAYNVRDGYARLWDWASPLVDLSAAMPSLFRQTPAGALGLAGLWLACTIAAWLSVRAIDRDGTRTPGTLAFATLSASWLAVVASLSVAWAAGGGATRTTASALWMLRAYDPRMHTQAVSYDGGTRGWTRVTSVEPDEAFSRISLGWESRRERRAGELLRLGPLPAGDYRLRFDLARSTDGALELSVGGAGAMLERWDLAGVPPGTHERMLRLPVPVARILLSTMPPAPDAISSASAHPLRLASGPAVSTAFASQALRVGDQSAFLLNDGAYVEAQGFWLRPGRLALVALAAREPAAGYRVRLQNAPVANTLHVRVGTWRQTLELAAGDERVVRIPSPPGAPTTVVEFRAERGFQPALIDPSSDDRRWLGCWIELR